MSFVDAMAIIAPVTGESHEEESGTSTDQVVLSLVSPGQTQTPPLGAFSRWCDLFSPSPAHDAVKFGKEISDGESSTGGAGDGAVCDDKFDFTGVAPKVADVARAFLPVQQDEQDRLRRRRRLEGWFMAMLSLGLAVSAAVAVSLVPWQAASAGDKGPVACQLLLIIVLVVSAAVVEHLPFWTSRPLQQLAATPAAAAGAGAVATPPRAWRLACLETALGLGRSVGILAFAFHAGRWRPGSSLAAALAAASRGFILLTLALCAVAGMVMGLGGGSLPNVFADDDGRRARNLLSRHLLALGSAIGFLGVGLRGFHRGDPSCDACFVAGVGSVARLVTAVTLDVPHFVLAVLYCGSCRLAGPGPILLGVGAWLASVTGLVLAVKAVKVDLPWFRYGSRHRQRVAALRDRGHMSVRWSIVQKQLRRVRHERRMELEQLEQFAAEAAGVGSKTAVGRPVSNSSVGGEAAP